MSKSRRSANNKKGIRANLARPEVDVTLRTSLYSVFAIAAGAVAILFMLGTDYLYDNIYPVLRSMGHVELIFGSLVAIVLGALLVGLLQSRYLPERRPNAIPDLKVFYAKPNERFSFRQVIINLVAGIVSLGSGVSLGREGPTVFMGGAIATACADAMGMKSTRRRRLACVAGAAAGLAAAFNTPIAAVTFALETITVRFNARQMGGILIAAVLGACASWLVIGRHPSFLVPELSSLSVTGYVLTPFVALLAAMVGVFFQRQTLRARLFAKTKTSLGPFLKPLVGGLLVWVIAILTYYLSMAMGDARLGVFGMGFDDLEAALANEIPWCVALLLLFAKLAATSLACAWGCSGGIFAPTLFFGTMTGVSIAGLATLFGADLGDHGMLLLAFVGMSSCFGTVVRTPLTALLIVFEMTSRYEIIPPLMIATVISQAYAYYFSDKLSIYDAILRQDGVEL